MGGSISGKFREGWSLIALGSILGTRRLNNVQLLNNYFIFLWDDIEKMYLKGKLNLDFLKNVFYYVHFNIYSNTEDENFVVRSTSSLFLV